MTATPPRIITWSACAAGKICDLEAPEFNNLLHGRRNLGDFQLLGMLGRESMRCARSAAAGTPGGW